MSSLLHIEEGNVPVRTIASEVDLEGLGPFSGERCRVRLHPNTEGTGILAQHAGSRIPCTIASLATESNHSTSLAASSVRLRAVEHLLSALSFCGVNNCIIEPLEGSEIPNQSGGSCLEYVNAITCVGFIELAERSSVAVIHHPARFSWDSSSAIVSPPPRDDWLYLEITVTISFPAPIGDQTVRWSSDPQSPDHHSDRYVQARSFLRRNLSYKWPDGRDHWTTLHDTIRSLPAEVSQLKHLAFDHDEWVNGPSYKDEPAWHKLMDLAGDITLLGTPLVGRVQVTRPGHAFNHRFIHWLHGSYQPDMPVTARLD